eukprot:1372099-Amorphochlora_amoeboformis.AAC.1
MGDTSISYKQYPHPKISPDISACQPPSPGGLNGVHASPGGRKKVDPANMDCKMRVLYDLRVDFASSAARVGTLALKTRMFVRPDLRMLLPAKRLSWVCIRCSLRY